MRLDPTSAWVDDEPTLHVGARLRDERRGWRLCLRTDDVGEDRVKVTDDFDSLHTTTLDGTQAGRCGSKVCGRLVLRVLGQGHRDDVRTPLRTATHFLRLEVGKRIRDTPGQ